MNLNLEVKKKCMPLSAGTLLQKCNRTVLQQRLLLWRRCVKMTFTNHWFNQKLRNAHPMLEPTGTRFCNEGVVPGIPRPLGGHQFRWGSGHQMPDEREADGYKVFQTVLNVVSCSVMCNWLIQNNTSFSCWSLMYSLHRLMLVWHQSVWRRWSLNVYILIYVGIGLLPIIHPVIEDNRFKKMNSHLH